MSGGSYGYLCWKAPDELLNARVQLREMADRLAGLGYARDAAQETEELICMLNQMDVRLNVRMRRLSDIFRQVEWWDSGDSDENAVKLAIERYRGGKD